MTNLRTYLKPYIPRMAFGLSIKFTGTIMDLLIPWILAYMIDYVVPQERLELIVMWGLMMVLCAIVAIVANIVANRMASRVARDTTRKVRHDLFSKISYLSSSQIDTFTLPSLISRLTSDTYHIHHMIGMMQRLGVRAPILLLGGIIVTLTLDPVLSLVLISILPLIGLLIFKVSTKGIPLYQTLQSSIDGMVTVIRENITGIRVIKALSKSDYEKKRYSKSNDDVVKSEMTVGKTMAITNPMMNLFLNLGLTLVVIVGAFRVNSGLTKPGAIIAFLTYFTIILNAMLSISRIFILYSKGTASFKRIIEVIDAPEELKVTEDDTIPSDAHISFNHVHFSYHNQKDNLVNLHFEVKKGETLGIIGPTGSGKSSIIQLLMRFYDVSSGEIRLNGTNIKSIPREKLHTKFGIVFQNDILFADTIAQNIAFGRNLEAKQILYSSELAQAGPFIDSLADGIHHTLSVKGANLSGGQKQRILISRALAASPEILILDDSSSALDYKTDAALRQSIKSNFKDTTTIIVAQRISSIMHADQILVIEDGQIIGIGTHESLMNTCENYQEISKIQMGGVFDESRK